MKPVLTLLMAAAVIAPTMVQAQAPAQAKNPTAGDSAQVKRGEYLVTTGLCHDCHTPLVKGPDGPMPDMTRALSGHPQDIVVKAPAPTAEGWIGGFSPTLSAWSGPWGISFAANLTPDPETGRLRDFTEEQFIKSMRTGRHQGQGRQILPPMPWQWVGKRTDEDLKAMFAYLRQIPAVRNRVPDPIPPARQTTSR